tara:strand:+ start:227 stop:394 length:168 start_codon:yes stop_codon:yes gene_type:complete
VGKAYPVKVLTVVAVRATMPAGVAVARQPWERMAQAGQLAALGVTEKVQASEVPS